MDTNQKAEFFLLQEVLTLLLIFDAPICCANTLAVGPRKYISKLLKYQLIGVIKR
jgi:hypothetical protein